MKKPLASKFVIAPDVLWRQLLQGKSGAVNTKTMDYYEFEGQSADVFSQFIGGKSFEQVVAFCCKKYPQESEKIEMEVERFFNFLVKEKLVLKVSQKSRGKRR